jgi:hypothetical protein
LLALPVQGVAASWMMFCGSSHEHPTLQGDPCPHAGSDLEFEQASGTVPESSEAACNACAACFLSMAIPARFVVMGSPDPERRVTRPPDATRPSHFLGGLERPPRPRQT